MKRRLLPYCILILFIVAYTRPHAGNISDQQSDHLEPSWIASSIELDTNIIPSGVFEMTELRTLKFRGMPCTFLKELHDDDDFRCWQLEEIPKSIKNLVYLEVLELPDNNINILPEELTQLPHLKELSLSDNTGIANLELITRLDSLEGLNLNGCGLSQLPKDIGRLKSLVAIGLTRNQFDSTEMARIREALPHCQVFF